MAECLLRASRAVRTAHSLDGRETVSMKKLPTGEPYAGKPPVRFGGRGRRKPIPTRIIRCGLSFGRCGRCLLQSITPGGMGPGAEAGTTDSGTVLAALQAA